jgi:hypothetical protein
MKYASLENLKGVGEEELEEKTGGRDSALSILVKC